MVLSRSVLSLVVAGAAVLTHAHLAEHVPNAARNARHASILSESCAANGKALLQEGGGATCLLDPETTVGPYGWPTAPIRQDITEGKEGIPMQLKIHVVNSSTCEPITRGAVQLWHAAADGTYSHYEAGATADPTDAPFVPTDNTTYLRGVQLIDETGSVEFTSIVPGWYQARAWHVHARVLFGIDVAEDNSGFTGGTSAHVGQLYAADEFIHILGAFEPYSENEIYPIETTSDFIYIFQGGPFGLMDITLQNPFNFADGIIGEVTFGVLNEQNGEVDIGLIPVDPEDEVRPR